MRDNLIHYRAYRIEWGDKRLSQLKDSNNPNHPINSITLKILTTLITLPAPIFLGATQPAAAVAKYTHTHAHAHTHTHVRKSQQSHRRNESHYNLTKVAQRNLNKVAKSD